MGRMTMPMRASSGLGNLDTTAVHAGREDLTALGVHVPSIDLSTTYPLPSVEAGGAAYDTLASGERPDAEATLVYQRLWNPGTDRFERAVAALEGTEAAVGFASGMAALTAVLLAAVAGGTPHVVAVRPIYGGSDHLLASGLLGTTVTWATPGTVGEAVRADTGLVLLETPANPSLDLVDIAAVVQQAGDVPVVVDNTFATPVLQQPRRQGASMVLHSATKFMGGHGDVMGGVVAADHAWTARLRQVRAITGAVLHPIAAYDLHRGLQTISVRVRAQQAAATTVAAWLDERPEVSRVHHPSRPGCDPLGLVGTQMSGPGAVVGFRLAAGYPAAAALLEHLELITHAVSLGGVDTLVQHPASLTHRIVASDARPDADLLRLSLGLESVEDVVADLDKALANLP